MMNATHACHHACPLINAGEGGRVFKGAGGHVQISQLRNAHAKISSLLLFVPGEKSCVSISHFSLHNKPLADRSQQACRAMDRQMAATGRAVDCRHSHRAQNGPSFVPKQGRHHCERHNEIAKARGEQNNTERHTSRPCLELGLAQSAAGAAMSHSSGCE